MKSSDKIIKLMPDSLFPSHKPVPLLFNQQRHFPIGLNLCSYIPSRLFDA